MKIILLLTLVFLFSTNINAQNLFKKDGDKFGSEMISVQSISANKIAVKVYYKSSQKCACEEEEVIEVQKDSKNQFVYLINDDPSNSLTINMKEDKIVSIIVVNTNDYECCSILSGSYLAKVNVTENSNKTPPKAVNENESSVSGKTIIAKYAMSEFGDLPHIIFEDEQGKRWDFGQGENNFCGFSFGQEKNFETNEKLVGKKFRIDVKLSKIKSFADDMETVIEIEGYIISSIKLID